MGNTILLADKSITIQKIVQLTFADDDYNIHSVSDGQTALDALPKIRPDLILADISLPVKSGYELCSTVRRDPEYSEFSNVPIILLAGIYETMDEDRSRKVEERVKEVQANDFLSKPFDPQLLISKVKQYLGESVGPTQRIKMPEADSAINLFDTEASAAPPDDDEKTMMLPGGPFGNALFAEQMPEDNKSGESSNVPVDIDAVKPVGEVVFGAESFPQVELGAEEEEQEEKNLLTPENGKSPAGDERFAGREEQEFEYSSGPVIESPFADKAGVPESVPLILPNADEPFGDVFQESQTVQWAAPSATSEEDSPFGVPEPPAIPAHELEIPKELQESQQYEEPVAAETPRQAEIPNEIEGFDDTWPGVPIRSNMAPAVEELFESEPSSGSLGEDSEELEPDSSENMQTETDALAPMPASDTQAPISSSQVSDDLIDRIAERVLNKLSERVVSEIVWQVVPDLAEKMIRRELEKLHASEE
jgi:CheY-like chemotaxis protein